ncbi:sugar phosphate isomerase/epimerase family protein [Pseudoalteromonas sp. GB56]
MFRHQIYALFVICSLAYPSWINAHTKDNLPFPVSVQLWSVKEALKKDFHGTLNALADMGFDGVEFAGDYGPYANNPSELKQVLEHLGLEASSAHIGFDALDDNNLANTLLFFKTLEVKTLYIPWDERAWDGKQIKQFTEQLNHAHQQAQRFDMEIGFHNHEREFEPYKGKTFWDYIALNTSESLPLQLDIGWVHYAKKDAISLVSAYPHRTRSTHIKVVAKDNGLNAILGQNDFAWGDIINALSRDGRVEWLVVEQEQYPQGMTPLESVAASKKALDDIMNKSN